jgi:O-antigen biosynthesis protein WbqP
VIDRLIAILIIMLFSPLILLVVFIIYLEDGRPVLFRQRRIGLNGVEFVFYKFRSMKLDTPELPSNQMTNPERFLLKSGKWFRKFSIDEIPNLFCIAIGDMNFVGYRPLVTSEGRIHELREKYGIYGTKPGVTGMAQVNGRDNITLEKKVAAEYYYLQNKDFVLRTKIIIKSILIVLRSAGVRF